MAFKSVDYGEYSYDSDSLYRYFYCEPNGPKNAFYYFISSINSHAADHSIRECIGADVGFAIGQIVLFRLRGDGFGYCRNYLKINYKEFCHPDKTFGCGYWPVLLLFGFASVVVWLHNSFHYLD